MDAAMSEGRPTRVGPFELPDVDDLTVGVLGGTGPQGRGLARRWALAGISVVIGSRTKSRAEQVAGELAGGVVGVANEECARCADIVVVAVPWEGHAALLAPLAETLRDRIVVDCVNPLGFDKLGAFAVPVAEGSAAEQAAALLPASRVVAAFHHVSATVLLDPGVTDVECDVLVAGDDRHATDTVQALVNAIPGMRGVYAGRLRNAGQIEALTANLISVNRRYKSHAGVRVTGVSPAVTGLTPQPQH